MIEEELFPSEMMPGALVVPKWKTDRVVFGSGHQSRNAVWLYPLHEVQFKRTEKRAVINQILHWQYNTMGAFKNFLFTVPFDFTSHADGMSAHGYLDQQIAVGDGATGSYQIIKNYNAGGDTFARPIQRPRSATVLVGVAGVQSTADWSLGTNGVITFTDNSGVITNITQASQAVVTETGHTRSIGETVHFDSVAGMTEINGLRGVIQSKTVNTYTVNINSSGFSAYTSGGAAESLPQSGETITAGFEFDMLVHFKEDDLPIRLVTLNAFSIDTIIFEEERIA